MSEEISQLVDELHTKVGLSQVDAHRSAFCVLSWNQGWSAAKIGRYLGISRARVGQKVEKLIQYAETRDDVPTLARLMMVNTDSRPMAVPDDRPVGFDSTSWADREFAVGMLSRMGA